MKKFNKFNKLALTTDLHLGRKNNSEIHNKDCIQYIDWFCANVKADPEIDGVVFLGDWHEHRAAINGATLKYSYTAAKKLNDLGLPVFFIIGNHDLYNRNNRDVYTTNPFDSLENFHLVHEEPLVLPENSTAIFPYLFENEYHTVLPEYASKYDVLFGHFEFKGFVLTGETRVHEHGPDHKVFSHPKRIFSGHFHKRQETDNVVYIGNAFPGDFGDANDFKRGMATYEFDTDELTFFDWKDCPKYVRADLSEILESPKKYLHANARVKSLVDIELTYEESTELKETLIKKYKLRELSLEEPHDLQEALKDTEFDLEGFEMESTTTIVKEMLRQIKSDKISADMLVKMYEEL
jgi:DNA repair exonuclease SbcCD nuclease subunit